MRLFEIDGLDLDKIRQEILQNCQPYLKEIGNPKDYKLYRGSSSYNKSIYRITPRISRRPLHTNKIYHELFDKAFNENGFLANRSNSLFLFGDKFSARSYGDVYVVYPEGEFDFTWSDKVRDLFLHLDWRTFGIRFDNIKLVELNRDKPLFSAFLLSNKITVEQFLDDIEKKPNMTIQDMFKKYNINVNKVSDGYINLLLKLINHKPEDIIDVERVYDWIGQNYMSKNLIAAIESDNEIMVRCNSAIVLPIDFDKELWENASF